MSWTPFITAVLVCNVLIGNLCLIRTASAASAQTPRSTAMMSRYEPAKCPWITQSTGPATESTEESPCATGHCFVQPDPHTQDTAAALQELPVHTLPVSPCPPVFAETLHEPLITRNAHSPPIPVDIGTVVLRR